ncbi:PROLACTIN REGULATORY ELEMENT BINDING PROTEIN [Salix purpurea]|uniref:PROLACTIN REGULATORY ELEMENT BINDING PROTEIN n=1 Tax=Salix purpurea TaxID=77065 RepID=A0A9Q0ZAP2_SALPP|nr:PROLACTIN REGULATORY ELEMENT BINDING PROTEIN [Salix purpurea]
MEPGQGTVTFGSWIRRPENVNLAVLGRSSKKKGPAAPSVLEIFSFDPETTSLSTSPQVCFSDTLHDMSFKLSLFRHGDTLFCFYVFETDGELVTIAVHPSGDDFVCSSTKGGCKLFELHGQETNLKLLAKELPPLQDVGPQTCMAFSVDGSRFATGGVDGRLRILEWPSLRIILDEPKAHKSVRDMDFSLDSEFLASTSTDGSARIWKAEDGSPVVSLTRNANEKIELCRFSKDGTKPFLFCAVQKGDKAVTAVYDISTWNKIGFKRLLRKPASIMSISLDGKYLALGSKDGDVCVAEVNKMEVSHLSKRLHLGTPITSLEFCPSQRVVLTTSDEWGAVVTKLNVPADWKEWQIYLLLVGLFLASAVAFYLFFQKSDSFWNVPSRRDQPGRQFEILDPQYSEDAFGPVDM